MKRLIFIVISVFLVLFIQAKYVQADTNALSAELCALSSNEVLLNLIVNKNIHPGNISLRAKIFQKDKLTAIGIRQIDILSLPVNGIKVRIPLSRNLSSKTGYSAAITVESAHHCQTTKIWKNITVSSSIADGFLSKRFKPIPEPFDLRNSIKGIRIRGEMGIL